MFKVNDYVMYGMTGACKVIDIKKEKFMNNEQKECYVLSPIYSKNMTIKIPIDNEKIIIRGIHSEEEVESLMEKVSDMDLFWVDNDRERSETFKSMLKNGECEDLITIVKSIHSNKKNKVSGKRTNKNDDEVMKTAENLLNEEFSISLGIDKEDVKSYILNHINE
ncbi:MAG: CarD family transcriptional regulator [Clostridium sp.]|uniref:CarD family transcriptional regulator n=1 Tax=Clostridium sp. TaxID=1506 RepID=UPI0029101D3F|nr:CarD family transcriptional regulator [Clostridium sp.]MDU4939692.1 CarD family transcriptional regulator [Clostridium sp.]